MLLVFSVVIMAIVGAYFVVGSHADPQKTSFIDISSPQCGHTGGLGTRHFGIVGLNGTRLDFNRNACLNTELKHFSSYGLYVGSNYPSVHCSSRLSPTQCGRKAALYDLHLAAHLHPVSWWIDVETGPDIPWSTPQNNTAFLRGMYDELKTSGLPVGFYSTQDLWNQITGGAHFNTLNWYATGHHGNLTKSSFRSYCAKSFGGGNNVYVQFIIGSIDYDVPC